MSVPTLRSLSASLGRHLMAAPGFSLPDTPVSAVHISELDDPTDYLSGGELLLTTGLGLHLDAVALHEYVARVRQVGVAGLGFGIGPVYSALPELLAAACRSLDVPLLVVPEPTPFITVSRAYWTAAVRSGEQSLIDQLTTHRALVDAAASDDPASAIVRTLAKWLEGWAATVGRDGQIQHAYPAVPSPAAQQVRDETKRLRSVGVHSAAAISINGQHIVVFPLAGSPTDTGYLAVGSPESLTSGSRRTVLAAASLLRLVGQRASETRTSRVATAGDLALLLNAGYLDAAQTLAAAHGLQRIAPRQRLLVLDSAASDTIVDSLVSTAALIFGRSGDDRLAWALMPATTPSEEVVRTVVLGADPAARAYLSAPIAINDVDGARVRLERTVAQLARGQFLVEADSSGAQDAEQALVRLAQAKGGEILERTLTEFLRHHGHWELAARALHVHRNTLRYRVTRAQEILNLDLDDPDVRAFLWLGLREVR